MNRKLEIKSAAIGLAIGVLVMLGIAAASGPGPGSVGRYQIAGTGNHGLIIDTATGQVWRGYFLSHEGKTDGDFFSPKTGEKK